MYSKSAKNRWFIISNLRGFYSGIVLFVLTFFSLDQLQAQEIESIQFTITVQSSLGEAVSKATVSQENDEKAILGTTNESGIIFNLN